MVIVLVVMVLVIVMVISVSVIVLVHVFVVMVLLIVMVVTLTHFHTTYLQTNRLCILRGIWVTPLLMWIVCHTSRDSCIQARYQLLYGIWAHQVGQSITLHYIDRGSFIQARSPLVYGLGRARCINP